MSALRNKSQVHFRERAELLDFLLEVSAVMSATLDLDQLMANVAEIVSQVIQHDLFAILLHSERQGGLVIRHARGHRDEIVKNLVVPLGEGITGLAAQTRQPILVNDVRSDPRYLNAMDAVRSELAVPMIARGKLVGVIDVQSTQQNAYSEQDRALLMLVGSRVAASIDNARLYRRLERQNRMLRTLTQLSQEFSSTLDLDELLSRIGKSIRTLINYDAFSIFLLDWNQKTLKHRFSVRYDKRVELDNIPVGLGIVGAAAEMGVPILVPDTLADKRYIDAHVGIRSELAVPLVLKDRVIGVMDLESERLGYFSEDHVRTLSLLAPAVGTALENARLYQELAQREQRMEQDLAAARDLQSVLLPRKAPEVHGLEIGVGLRPAHEISGDLYDFFEHGDEYALIAFGDSSGKGAAAALYGALVSGLLRTLAPRRRGPALLMRALNEALLERKVDAQYVTLLLMLWEPRERLLTVANAGAIPPMVSRNGQILRLNAAGVPLGLLEGREYEEVRFEAQPGDIILLYSDGIQDEANLSDEEYGRCRLAQLLTQVGAESAQGIVDAVLRDLDQYGEGRPPLDDQTLIALKVT
jgi:Serine phosphatase RsbU, regulator of sigma subunit